MTTSAPGPPPLPPTPLIGRAEERAVLHALLTDDATRLVTLVGPPGVGKTLLAQHLARDLAPTFAAGAAFVPLDALRDPALVPAAVARSLDVREAAGRPPAAAVAEHLADRQILLVLDNLEQVIEAATFIVDLLAAAPGLRILATSRTPLRLRAEQQVPLAPLSLVAGDQAPAEGHATTGPTATPAPASAAVQLFVARARAVRPDFALAAANAADVAAICAALDGLPLALELAAARIALLSPAEILARLGRRLALLTGGYRDLPDRHRTLRAAIDWSYDLLAPEEQRLLRLLGIFPGGATLDAAEAVAGTAPMEPERFAWTARDGGSPVLDRLGALADHNLLRRTEDPDGTSRFRMLETIREYAIERLAAAGDAEEARLHVAVWYLAFAERADEQMHEAEQALWMDRLDAEHDNLRAVLAWTLDHDQATLGLDLIGRLYLGWSRRNHVTEGRLWLDRLLAAGGGAPLAVRARATFGAGILAEKQDDFPAAAAHTEQALALYRECADDEWSAIALSFLGDIALGRSDDAAAAAYIEEALALARAIDDTRTVESCLNSLGVIALRLGRVEEARGHHEECLAISRQLGDVSSVAAQLNNLAHIARRVGDLPTARATYEEAVALSRATGNGQRTAIMLTSLADVVQMQGDLPVALGHAQEALRLAEAFDDRAASAFALLHVTAISRKLGDLAAARSHALAGLEMAVAMDDASRIAAVLWQSAAYAAAIGRDERAARLFGAAAEASAPSGGRFISAQETEAQAEALSARLGDFAFAAAWREGAGLPLQDAVQEAFDLLNADDGPPPASAPTVGPTPAGLTAREAEVLGLLAAGESNRAIADRLVVSERTVEHHIANIYRKIDARGRVDATAYALRHGLTQP